MVITQKITSMAFEIHDGKCVFVYHLEGEVPDMREVKMPVWFS